MGDVIQGIFPRHRTQEEVAMTAALEHLAVSIFDTLHLPSMLQVLPEVAVPAAYGFDTGLSEMPPESA